MWEGSYYYLGTDPLTLINSPHDHSNSAGFAWYTVHRPIATKAIKYIHTYLLRNYHNSPRLTEGVGSSTLIAFMGSTYIVCSYYISHENFNDRKILSMIIFACSGRSTSAGEAAARSSHKDLKVNLAGSILIPVAQKPSSVLHRDNNMSAAHI